MAENDTVQLLLTEASLALGALRAVNTPGRAVVFLRAIGYELPPAAVGPALPQVAASAGALASVARQLADAEGPAAVADAVSDMLGRVEATVSAIRTLHAELESAAGSIPNLDEFPRRLTDFLLLDYLERHRPLLHDTLHLLGLIECEHQPKPGESTRVVHWDRFGRFVQEPSRIADDVYRWNTEFDSDAFLERLLKVMRDAPLPGGLYPQADATRAALGNTGEGGQELRFPIFEKGFSAETYGQFGITFVPADAEGEKKKGLALLPYLMGTSTFDFGVCERGQLAFESTADIRGVGLVVRPPFAVDPLLTLAGAFRAAVRISERPDRAEEVVLLGSAGGSRLAIQGQSITWFAQNPTGALDLGFEAQLQAIRLVLGGGDGDGFLQKVLSGLDVHAEASLTVGMTLLTGFTVQGSGQLAVDVSTHMDLGPVQIDSLRLAIAPADDQIALEAGAVLRAQLGPLRAVVENVGVRGGVRFEEGNLGPAHIDTAFKPPVGVGLAIDGGIVKGGGFLSFDPAQGRYAGALQLAVGDFLALNAVGVITTRMPNGSAGFSLLIMITAEFSQGIQLGLGFTLLGVGGLLGLNRTVRLQALIDGVRTGAIDSVMFPQDVLANAPRIISDLEAFFPAREGRFLIGPMAKLGWGTPVLVRIVLGVIVEIPGNISIVGAVRIAVPTPDAPLVFLQVRFAGAIDLDRRRLFFFATLFESRIAFVTLEGEMGLLLAYGDDANFVVTVGGFHPRFAPPPLPFPTPVRIALPLLNSSAARVNADCYIAVTSNTVQFGARVEVFFGFKSLSVQGHVSFDALFRFSPFHFTVDIAASFSVKVFGTGVFSVKVRGTIDGPAPWHIEGHGSISLLFWSIDVDFSKTWGEVRNPVLPPVSVFPLVLGELGKSESWRALLPGGNRLLVSVRTQPRQGDTVVLHPLGALQISQRSIPLGVTVDRVGNQRPGDVNRITIEAPDGTGLVKQDDAFEMFAPAQFRDFSDAERLSKPAFTRERSGVQLSAADGLRSSGMVRRNIRYEEIIVDSNFKRFARPFSGYAGSLFDFFTRGASVARNELSHATNIKRQPTNAAFAVIGDTYAVAFAATNQAVANEAIAFPTESSAREYMRRRIAADGSLADALHVIPTVERAA
jgi:hypothetical protein